MLQGLVKKSQLEFYWSKRASIFTPFFNNCMSGRRFKAIRKYLHFMDKETYDPETHPNSKLHKFYDLYAYLNSKFKSSYLPGRDISIDESLMKWKGRLSWKQFIPLKRARFGVKFFVLAEANSGYVWNTFIYTGKGAVINPAYEKFAMSTQVVLSLSEDLLGKGHSITTDNYYTSPELAEILISKNTDLYGTVKSTRKGMPREFAKSKMKKGDFLAFRKGKILALKWKDKREVTLLSTVHRAAFTNVRRHDGEVKVPEVIMDYNNTMGGVDRADRGIAAYEIKRKQDKKYYRKIFFHLLEICVWNSFVLYEKSGGALKQLEFRIKLVEEIVERCFISKLRCGRPSSEPNPLRLEGRHFPDYIEETQKKKTPTRDIFRMSKAHGSPLVTFTRVPPPPLMGLTVHSEYVLEFVLSAVIKKTQTEKEYAGNQDLCAYNVTLHFAWYHALKFIIL